MAQTKFVKYKTLKYFKSITQILDRAKIHEYYFLDIANESKLVKYTGWLRESEPKAKVYTVVFLLF